MMTVEVTSLVGEGQPAFVAPKNRDAWATVRGYIYQADLTIERWLHLEPEQELFLECGEDIDTVSKYIDGTIDERVVEQVKHREDRVTLKTDSALTALANALEHQRNNPSPRIIFRFTTNAEAGKERLSSFTGNTSGIKEWEALRMARIAHSRPGPIELNKETETTANNIRQTLLSATRCPSDLNHDIWGRFRTFLKDADVPSFLEFVDSFEWSTGAPAANEMTERIQAMLVDCRFAADEIAAYSQYQALFLHALKTLSKKGEKRLSKATLVEILSRPLSGNETKFVEQLFDSMGLLVRKMNLIKEQMVRQERTLQKVAEDVRLMLKMGEEQSFSVSTPVPIFEPPPADETLSPRTQTVDQLQHDLTQLAWLAITGSSGVGKSSLALLLVSRLSCNVWMRLRDFDIDRAAAAFDATFSHLSGDSSLNRKRLYTEACRSLAPDSVIVLDDLPNITGGDALAQRLEILYLAAKETGRKIVTTSAHRLPTHFDRLCRGHFLQVSAPPLTELDAAEILQCIGAPPSLYGDRSKVAFLNIVSRRQPALLVAVTLFLKSSRWEWSDQQLQNLRLGEFAHDINAETMQRLLNTVTDNETRKLLYRLNLVLGPFNLKTVQSLATIPPPILEPRERLAKLTGLWVQRDTGGLMRVSPLIQSVGSDDLTAEVIQECSRALAEQLLQTRIINIHEAEHIFTYLVAANELENSASFLAFCLNELFAAITRGEVTIAQANRLTVVSIYSGHSIPITISLNTRLLLRAQQIRLAEALSRDTSFLAHDLTQLVEAAGENEAIGLLAVALLAVPHLACVDFDSSCRCLTTAATILPHAALPETVISSMSDFISGTLLWMNITGVRSRANVLRWVDMITEVSDEVRTKALNHPLSVGALQLFYSLWSEQTKLPRLDRNWRQVFDDCEVLRQRAESVKAGFLAGLSSWGAVVLLCEELNDIDSAIGVANVTLSKTATDARVTYLVSNVIGVSLSIKDGREAEAEDWLLRAYDAAHQIPEPFKADQPNLLVGLARVEDKRGDTNKSAVLLRQAAELVKGTSSSHRLDIVKALGDVAIGEWKNGQCQKAFEAVDEAALILIEAKTDSLRWKALYALLGHTIGYMTGVASLGTPPQLENGTPLVLPPIGRFNRLNEEAFAAIYQPEKEIVLPSTMAEFSLAMHRDDRAIYWADRMVEMGRTAPLSATQVISTTLLTILPHTILAERMIPFFDNAREAIFITSAMSQAFKKGKRNLLFSPLDVESELNGRGSNEWDDAEQRVLEYTLGLLALHLGCVAITARDDSVIDTKLRKITEQIGALCLESAAISTRPGDWEEAEYLVRACYENSPDLHRIVARTKSLKDSQKGVLVFGYIGATMDNTVVLKDACRLQMAVIPYILSYYLNRGQHLLLLPFIEKFWGWALKNRRVNFSPPAVVESEFEEALASPIEARAKRIMSVVARGLGVRNEAKVADAFSRWEGIKT